ncbi:MAG: c-type cytochrome [Magnetovibrio sp.]|nr:c-type cytochrome [Magnetovibrio sp.]
MTVETKQAQATVDQLDPQVIATGQLVYGQYCASCHGKDLKGQPDWQVKKTDGTLPAPPHDKDGHTWHHDDGVLFNYTKGGGASLGIDNFKSGMPPFEGMIDDEKIWSVLAYIKSTWPQKNRARQNLATQQTQN